MNLSSMLSLKLARCAKLPWLRQQSIVFLLAPLIAATALHYPTAVFGGALVFWSPTLMRRLLPRLRHWWLAGLTAFGFLMSWVPAGRTQGLFGPAQKAMQCVVSSAGSGSSGDSTGMLTKLPFIIFTGINIVILGYFIYVVVEAISSYGRGETVSHVVQVPIVTFIFLIFLFLFSNFLFSGATC